MSWRGEVEDGSGLGGLVESKAEREERKAHRAEMLKHYGSGLEDGRADQLAKFAALLPGPHYMDPPDGGDVSVLEQVRRMAEDAARWRWFMAGLGDQGPKLATSVDMAIQEDGKAAPSKEAWTDRFAPRESCRGCHPGHCNYPVCVKPGARATGGLKGKSCMNADDFAFGAPDGPNTEEAAELENVLPPTLEDAYAEGRKDEREDFRTLLQQTQCVRDGWHPFTALSLQAELLAALDDASQCQHCYGKGWNDESKAVDGHYQGAEVFRIECAHCGGSGHAG